MERTITLQIKTDKLPDGMHGASLPGRGAGRYIVILNEAETADEQAATFIHEMLHIWHGDHEKGGNVNQIEAERHAETRRLLSILTGMEE